jgi:hypothetical protein
MNDNYKRTNRSGDGCENTMSDFSNKESGSGSTTPNRKMTYVYLNNNEYIRRSPVVINGFSVVNGVYGIGHHAFWRNSFRPKLNEYKYTI